MQLLGPLSGCSVLWRSCPELRCQGKTDCSRYGRNKARTSLPDAYTSALSTCVNVGVLSSFSSIWDHYGRLGEGNSHSKGPCVPCVPMCLTDWRQWVSGQKPSKFSELFFYKLCSTICFRSNMQTKPQIILSLWPRVLNSSVQQP